MMEIFYHPRLFSIDVETDLALMRPRMTSRLHYSAYSDRLYEAPWISVHLMNHNITHDESYASSMEMPIESKTHDWLCLPFLLPLIHPDTIMKNAHLDETRLTHNATHFYSSLCAINVWFKAAVSDHRDRLLWQMKTLFLCDMWHKRECRVKQ